MNHQRTCRQDKKRDQAALTNARSGLEARKRRRIEGLQSMTAHVQPSASGSTNHGLSGMISGTVRISTSFALEVCSYIWSR